MLLTELPDDVLLFVARQLFVFDLFNLSLTCRIFYYLAKSSATYWRHAVAPAHLPRVASFSAFTAQELADAAKRYQYFIADLLYGVPVILKTVTFEYMAHSSAMTSAPGTRWLFTTATADHPRPEFQGSKSVKVLCIDLWTGQLIGSADILWERDDHLLHLNAQAVDADTIVLSLANLGAKYERLLFYQVRLFEGETKPNAVFQLLKEVELPLDGLRLRFVVEGDYAALQSRSQTEPGSDAITLLIFNWTKEYPSWFVYRPPQGCRLRHWTISKGCLLTFLSTGLGPDPELVAHRIVEGADGKLSLDGYPVGLPFQRQGPTLASPLLASAHVDEYTFPRPTIQAVLCQRSSNFHRSRESPLGTMIHHYSLPVGDDLYMSSSCLVEKDIEHVGYRRGIVWAATGTTLQCHFVHSDLDGTPFNVCKAPQPSIIHFDAEAGVVWHYPVLYTEAASPIRRQVVVRWYC